MVIMSMIKEGMLDVLMYLFENYMQTDCGVSRDHDELIDELEGAGFSPVEIDKAFVWLEELSEIQDASAIVTTDPAPATRVYMDYEYDMIGSKGIGLISFLNQIGVLNTMNREIVIDRAMAFDGDDLGAHRLKWVILMVLFNNPETDAELAWMEDFIAANKDKTLH